MEWGAGGTMDDREVETSASEPEIAVELAKPGLVVQRHGGALRAGGVAGHRGGTGRPRESLRELARRKYAPVALKQLHRISKGERFLKDAEGNLVAPTYGQVVSASKAVADVALSVESIPEALLQANVSLMMRLQDLFPETVTRPLTDEELAHYGKELEQALGNPKVA